MTRQINSINFPGIDKYIVDANAANGSYTTISQAITAATSVGNIIEVLLSGGTSWTITQASGKSIVFGNRSSTTGTGGSLASTAAGDGISMRCVVANTRWQVIASQGNILIV